METFGTRLRTIRERNGMTTTALADALGVQQPMITRIENGQRGKRFEMLPRLARALGCRIDDLFPEMDAPDTETTQRPAENAAACASPAPAAPPAQTQDDDDDWLGFEW